MDMGLCGLKKVLFVCYGYNMSYLQSIYTSSYYHEQVNGASVSAGVLVPLVLSLVPAKSVVDVGCGAGAWLAVFKKNGVETVLGIDGGGVDLAQLQISPSEFMRQDLTSDFRLDRKFDLAVSLEVAEHLEEKFAIDFVKNLTSLSQAVLFSAAQPFQGGKHHVNEQWPEYWVDIFSRYGYTVLDPFRRLVWDDPGVEWWYAQNILLFVQDGYMRGNELLLAEHGRLSRHQLSLVHPKSLTFQRAFAMLPGWVFKFIKNRYRRFFKPA